MDTTWLALLVVAVIVNGLIRWRLYSEMRELDRKTAIVLSVLIVWAETWGEHPDIVKARLIEVLKS